MLKKSKWVKHTEQYLSVQNILVLIGVIIFVYFISDLITTDWMHDLIRWLGPLGPLGVVVYVVASHIFAPVVGSPGVLLSVGLFGLWQTMILAYIGGLVSSTIAFWISKKWGRELVIKFVGKDTMKDVDEFVDAFDEKLLIFARLFGFPMFDVISYAAGLTPLDFKTYFIITAVFSAIPAFTVNYAVFNFADFSSRLNSYVIVGLFFSLGIVFVIILRRYIKAYRAFKEQKARKG